MADVFVSYARPDQAHVRPIVDQLQSAGFSVWWDRALEPGHTWADVIDRELRRALCVVVIWSRHSATSRWVGIEANEARRRGILVPVAIEPVTLGDEFAGLHRLEWHAIEDPQEANRRLVDYVARVTRRSRRRRWRVPAVCASAALVGMATWLGLAGEQPPRLVAEPGAPIATDSIAVLPFRQDASVTAPGLGEGIALDVLDELARATSLRVASRVASWPTAEQPVETIRERLRVAWLVEGDVSMTSDGLDVTVRLVDAATGFLTANWTLKVQDDELAEMRSDVAQLLAEALPDARWSERPRATPALAGIAYRPYLQARALLREGRNPVDRVRAESYLQQSLAAEPDFAPARAGLCQVLLWRHDLNQDSRDLVRAAEECTAAMALAPDDPVVVLAQAELDAARGEHLAASKLLVALLEQDPSDADARRQLALSLAAMDRAEEAEQAFRRVLNEQPGHWAAHNDYALFLLGHGRAEEAVRQFVRALDLAPEEPSALSNLGAGLLMADELPAAMRAFQRSLAAGETAAALSNLGTAYYYANRLDEAANAFERATKLVPNDFRVWSNLGDARALLDDPRAADAYREAERLAIARLSSAGSDPTARIGIEAFRAALGTGSVQSLQAALGQVTSTWETEYFAALAYSRHGASEQATLSANRAIDLGFPEPLAQRDPLLQPLLQPRKQQGDSGSESIIHEGDEP